MGTGQNVTELKQIERRMLDSEQRFRLLIEEAVDYAIFLIDLTGRIQTWNVGAERLKGYTSEEAIGKHFTMFYTPEDRQRSVPEGLLREATLKGRASADGWRVRKDGTRFWASVVITAVKDRAGKHFGFSKITRDMTERMKAEEALKESKADLERRVEERTKELLRANDVLTTTQEAMRASEDKFKQLADSMPPIVWAARADGYLDYYNERWYQFTGFKRGEGGDQSWLPILHPEDARACLDGWYDAVKSGKPFQGEYRFKDRKNGGYRWFLGRALPIKNAKGHIERWYGTCTDIHDQKMTELKLAEHANELMRSNRELEQFAYVTSHDLQEPLRKITNYVELLEMIGGDTLSEKTKECLKPIVGSVRRMHDLINGLLSYSRVSSTQGETGPVDLNKEVRTVLDSIESAKNADIHVERLPTVQANAIQLRQVFQNLISNALKFRDGGKPEVCVTAEKKGREWVFCVKDNGIGVSDKYKEQIFVIFQRLHTQERYPGTGIGLAICKKIVEGNGGRIWVESQEGKGSNFCFTLPEISTNG